MDAIERAVIGPQIEIAMHRGARRQILGNRAATDNRVDSTYSSPFTTSRTITVRLSPPGLAGGISALNQRPLVPSDRWDSATCYDRNERGCAVHMAGLLRIMPTTLESQQIYRVKNFRTDTNP